jgi:NAD(P)-dependent dehydrogenase (short-subunit alcohol dehydrogenase family)
LAAALRAHGLGAGTAADVQAAGDVRCLVWLATGDRLGEQCAVHELAPDEWIACTEPVLQAALIFFRDAHRALRKRDSGQVIVVVPTIAMTGAPLLVAWATVAEATRSLVRSAARVWGADGITVNCVAVPSTLLAAGPEAVPGLPPTALTAPGMGEVAQLVASLLGPIAVTGQTIAVDGGVWMAP